MFCYCRTLFWLCSLCSLIVSFLRYFANEPQFDGYVSHGPLQWMFVFMVDQSLSMWATCFLWQRNSDDALPTIFFSLSVARVTPLHDKALAMSKIMHVPSVRLVLRSQKYDFFLFFLFAVEWKCWFFQLFWREAKTVLTTPQKMIST